MTNLIKTFNKKQLRYGAHSEVMVAFSNEAYRITATDERFKAPYKTFSDALEEEQRCILLLQKSPLTATIAENDRVRARFYNVIKTVSAAWSSVSAEPQTSAAKNLQDVIGLHRVNTRAQYDQEGGAMRNALDDMQEGDLEKLGLTSAYEQAVQANGRVTSLLMQRNVEWAERDKSSLSAARNAVDAAYDDLVERINAAAVWDTAGTFDNFISVWNTNIDRIKREILNKGKAKDEREEGGDTTPTDTTAPTQDEDDGGTDTTAGDDITTDGGDTQTTDLDKQP